MTDYFRLPTFDSEKNIHVVVECSKGATAKFKYDVKLGAFTYSRPLATGLSYPFDWGFIPSTCGEDGDPLDALIIHETASQMGVVIACRVVGVLQVEQTVAGKTFRNDRFILQPAVGAPDDDSSPQMLDSQLHTEIEQFFLHVVFGTGKKLNFLGWSDSTAALASIKEGARHFSSHSGKA